MSHVYKMSSFRIIKEHGLEWVLGKIFLFLDGASMNSGANSGLKGLPMDINNLVLQLLSGIVSKRCIERVHQACGDVTEASSLSVHQFFKETSRTQEFVS